MTGYNFLNDWGYNEFKFLAKWLINWNEGKNILIKSGSSVPYLFHIRELA
jgi:hypothetical protein